MRANINVKKRFFQRAHKDLLLVLAEAKKTKTATPDSQAYVVYILLAKCENQFGEVARGIKYLHTGLAALDKHLTPAHRADMYLELVINYLTISDVVNVEKYLGKLFALDPTHLLAHGYNGLFHQNKGEAAASIAAYTQVLASNPREAQSLHFIGLGHLAQGHYREAMDWFDRLLSVDSSHYAWCLKEIAWYRWRQLDTPLSEYSPDAGLHWLLRDAWIRRSPRSEYCRGAASCHKNLQLVTTAEVQALEASSSSVTVRLEDFYSPEQAARFRHLVDTTKQISSWIQVDSPGFLVHRR